MIVAHLSELHLGFRAYHRTERGRNVRERDVAEVFERAIQEVGRLRPDLVLVAGDIFDRADPPPSAFLALTRGLDALRGLLPGVPVVLVAGARDTPLRPGDANPLAVVESFPGVEVATGTVRGLDLAEIETHVCLLPYRAGVREPFPVPSPEARARHNILVGYGAVGRDPGVEIDPGAWSYVALGGEHGHRVVAPNVAYAGALERVGGDPWSEAGEEKGFATLDLAGGGRVRFHPLPVRPVVSLAPVRTPPGGVGRLPDRVREVTREVPGGLEDKIVRLRIRGVRSRDLLVLQGPLLADLTERAFHLDVEVEPDGGVAEMPVTSDSLRRALDRAPRVAERIDALLGRQPASDPPPALRARLVERDPVLGEIDLRLPGGCVAILSGDDATTHRLFRLLADAEAGPPPPWLDPHPSTPGELVDELVDVLVRLRGLGPIEAVLRRLSNHAERGEGDVEQDAESLERRLLELEDAEEGLREIERELRNVRADHAEMAGDLEEVTMEWHRERQDAETHLQAYRDRARELRASLADIEEAGPDAPCPTCGRTLADHFDEVMSELREEWESVVQDGIWWKRRREQLDVAPEPLQEIEGRTLRLQAEVERCTERLEAARSRVRERDELRERLAELRVGTAGTADGGDTATSGSAVRDPAGLAEAIRVLEGVAGEVREGVRAPLLDRASRLVAAVTGSRVLALTREDDGTIRFEGPRAALAPTDEELAAASVSLRLAGAELASAAGRGGGSAGVILPSSLVERLREEDRLHLLDALPLLGGTVRHVLVGMRAATAERRHEVLDGILEVAPGGSGSPALRWLPSGPSPLDLTSS